MRYDGKRYYIALMNTDRTNGFPDVTVTLPFGGNAALWDCRTGEVWQQECTRQGNSLTIKTSFEPIGEKVYTVSAEMPEFAKKTDTETNIQKKELSGKYAYRLDEPNICVLDVATWQIQGQPQKPLAEILKIDRGIRDHFGLPYRGGDMLQPWHAEKYLPDNSQELGRVTLDFPFDVETIPSGELFLCLETPERFSIGVNGMELEKTDAGWYIDPSIRKMPLSPALLKKGKNHLTLTFGFSRDLNLEALLLTGDFGVRLNGIARMLTPLPDSLAAGDIVSQGLPFYSGAVTYRIGELPVPKDGQKVFLEVPSYDGACLKTADGQVAAWSPYRLDVTEAAKKGEPAEVTVVLTRRNTFGPLHALPARMGAYGPMHWTTEGKSFTLEKYVLLPAGLTYAPTVVVTGETPDPES